MTYLLRLVACQLMFVCINANATQFAHLIHLSNFQGSSDTELNGSNLTITYTFDSSQPETSYDYANGMNATSYAAVSAVIEVSNSPNSDGIYTATNPSVILRTNFGANNQNWIEYSGLPSFNTPEGDASISPGIVFNENYIAGGNGFALQLPQDFTTSEISTLTNDKLTVGDAFGMPWESSEYEASSFFISGCDFNENLNHSFALDTNANAIFDLCEDVDGDGTNGGYDYFPFDVSESVDTDGDGVGNNADNDDDSDGINDDSDAFPLDFYESIDTDGDGIGNNADFDDDGDGFAEGSLANLGEFKHIIYLSNFQGSSDTELNGSNLTITYTFDSSQPETSYDYANGMNATSYAAVSAVIEVSNSPNSDGIYTATNPSVILRTNFGANNQNWIEYSGLPSFNTPEGDASISPGIVFNENYIAGGNGFALQLPQDFTTSEISTLTNDKLTVGDAFGMPWESSEYEAVDWASYAYSIIDNCPTIPNPGQEDFDLDALGDACDNDKDGDGFTSGFDLNDLNAYFSTDPDGDGVDSSGESHYTNNVCLRAPNCNENDPCVTVCYVPPQDNCPTASNSDQNDLDDDNLGNVCDPDKDGDGLTTAIEDRHGGTDWDQNDFGLVVSNIENHILNSPADSDLDGVPDEYETAAGGDTISSTYESVLAMLTINKNVPAMGGIGLLALGLSMLGLGAVRSRKRH